MQNDDLSIQYFLLLDQLEQARETAGGLSQNEEAEYMGKLDDVWNKMTYSQQMAVEEDYTILLELKSLGGE